VAGGWESASELPATRALHWIAEIFRERRWAGWWKAYQAYCSTLPAYANGGTPPEPPEPPED